MFFFSASSSQVLNSLSSGRPLKQRYTVALLSNQMSGRSGYYWQNWWQRAECHIQVYITHYTCHIIELVEDLNAFDKRNSMDFWKANQNKWFSFLRKILTCYFHHPSVQSFSFSHTCASEMGLMPLVSSGVQWLVSPKLWCLTPFQVWHLMSAPCCDRAERWRAFNVFEWNLRQPNMCLT